MTFVTREEIIKLCKMSQIEIHDQEIDGLTQQLEEVLSYAARVIEVAEKNNRAQMPKNVNIMREDIIKPSCGDVILAQAPLVEENYFVVPSIIKHQE